MLPVNRFFANMLRHMLMLDHLDQSSYYVCDSIICEPESGSVASCASRLENTSRVYISVPGAYKSRT